MKKGRFSEKNRANWVLTSSCAASASTCEKSGLIAPEKVRFGVIPQRAVRPRSDSGSPASIEPSGKPWRTSVRWPVRVGSNSRFRPGVAPAKPVTFGIWQSRQLSSGSMVVPMIWCRRLRG
jgi:hypothetical protein